MTNSHAKNYYIMMHFYSYIEFIDLFIFIHLFDDLTTYFILHITLKHKFYLYDMHIYVLKLFF